MRFVELENVSNSRLIIKAARLTFEIGEKKKVHPSTVKHPTVTGLLGSGLRIVNGKAPIEEPKAPESTTTIKTEPAKIKVSEPIATTTSKPVEIDNDSTTESIDQSSGKNLREMYISAPGITEDNVDIILNKYPTLNELKNASKTELVDLGVYKSQAKKLVVWASEQ